MLAEYFLAFLFLGVLLIVIAGPSLIAAYRWRFGGGKLLNDRLNQKSPTHNRH
jgi:hypothetical protein